MPKNSQSISASELVDILKTELNGAIDRLSTKLVDESSSPTPAGNEAKEPGARRLITLDGNTYIVAKLPDGIFESDAEKIQMQVYYREGLDAKKEPCMIHSDCGCQFKF